MNSREISSYFCSQTYSVDLRCQYCERHGPWRNGIKCNSMWISYLWVWEEGFFKVFLFLVVFESLSDDHACFRDYTCSHNWFTPFIQIATASVASTHVCTLPITSSNPNLPTKLSVSTSSSSKKRLRENCSRPSSGLGPHQVWAVLLKTWAHHWLSCPGHTPLIMTTPIRLSAAVIASWPTQISNGLQLVCCDSPPWPTLPDFLHWPARPGPRLQPACCGLLPQSTLSGLPRCLTWPSPGL